MCVTRHGHSDTKTLTYLSTVFLYQFPVVIVGVAVVVRNTPGIYVPVFFNGNNVFYRFFVRSKRF